MTIAELIAKTKANDPDIKGIIISINDKNSKEYYFGELEDVPEIYLTSEIKEISQICASSDEKREGAYEIIV